jgi:hypothetical protein
MVLSPDNSDCLESSVSRAILEQLTQALERASFDRLARPVLRIEAFIQDGDNGDDDGRLTDSPSRGRLVASVCPPSAPFGDSVTLLRGHT